MLGASIVLIVTQRYHSNVYLRRPPSPCQSVWLQEMTTTQDILNVCKIEKVSDRVTGWHRILHLIDKDNNQYRMLLGWDTYDGYTLFSVDNVPLSDQIADLLEMEEIESLLDELTEKQ